MSFSYKAITFFIAAALTALNISSKCTAAPSAFTAEKLIAVNETDSNYTNYKNEDIASEKRGGWSIEVPKNWYSIPDVKPGWPKGAGWRTSDGSTGLIITWLPSVDSREYETLRSRRYLESETEMAGQKAKLFHKIEGPNFRQAIYIECGDGLYRIISFGITKDKAQLQKIVHTFSMLSASEHTLSAQTYTNSNMGVSFTMPSSDRTYSVKETAKGFNIMLDSEVIISVTPRSSSAEQGQSFRGLARQLGKILIPDASSLKRFEPYQIDGKTAYLTVWQLTNDTYAGPIVYAPYSKNNSNILEFDLKDPKYIDDFFKILNSAKF